jgi:tetratricopeptide (TPR) repeat protein
MHQPVEAGPPSTWYRVRKTARRNRVALTTTTLVALALVAGTALSLWQATVARRQATRAVRAETEARAQRDRARTAVDEMYTEVAEKWLSQEAQLEPLQRELLAKALAFYQEFARERADDVSVRMEVGRALRRVAEIEEALGRHSEAASAFEQSVAEFRQVVDLRTEDPLALQELAESYFRFGSFLTNRGRSGEAESALRRAEGIYRSSLEGRSDPTLCQEGLSRALNQLGILLDATDRTKDAETCWNECSKLLEELSSRSPGVAKHHRALGALLNNLAMPMIVQRRAKEARRLLERAIRAQQSALEIEPRSPKTRRFLINHLINLGLVLRWAGVTDGATRDEATRIVREFISATEELVRDFPSTPQFRLDLADSHYYAGDIYKELHLNRDAEQEFRTALKIYDTARADLAGYPESQMREAHTYGKLVLVLPAQSQREKIASEISLRGLELLDKVLEKHPERSDFREAWLTMVRNFGWHVLVHPEPRVGDRARALEIARKAVERAPNDATAWNTLGLALYRAMQYETALNVVQKAIERRGARETVDHLLMAMIQARRGEKSEAQQWFDKVSKTLYGPGTLDGGLIRLRDEAAALLGFKQPGAMMPNGLAAFVRLSNSSN